MMWDHLFGQKLCESVPLASKIQGNEKTGKNSFSQQKMVTGK